MKRRTLLGALGSAGLAWHGLAASDSNIGASTRPAGQRVVIIGGGWAGLSAARVLRQSAPELQVLLIDRDPQLRSLPLSSPWLVGRTPERLARVDLAALAQVLGYRFVAADVQTIDRTLRQVHTAQGRFDYDWLVLAAGIDYDYTAWFGDDTRATAQTREQFPAGFMASELDLLKRQLDNFRGGDLVMTIPPPPYRCPPAPYERAMLIGWWLKTKRLPGKLTVIDAGAGIPRFNHLFAERYADQIVHRPHSDGLSIDPFARKLSTDEGEIHFKHAILLPPMQASKLVAQTGLLGTNAQGQSTRWAGVDPLRLRSPVDERVYLVGDLIDTVSPLFGYYPKTAHVATRLGTAAALQIAAHSRGESPSPVALPQSICHVWLDADPAEQLIIDAQYRQRGDGLITQAVRQHDNPQPRDEDLQWARSLYAESLGVPAS
ncbi:MAG: FAD-dependent oxidoreductase [Rhodoferax sp.]|uniref:FAD-dependent oxidoreductase n=1 Tax=Rhodoferax sp. TaxID=50421 RepID=UPI003015E302